VYRLRTGLHVTAALEERFALENRAELDRLREWLREHLVSTFAVSGSREWVAWRIVWNVLSYMPPDAVLYHGKAYGLDCLAQAFWRDRGGKVREFPATRRMWSELGNRAGIVRNEIMLNRMPDVVPVFIRDNSPGSSHAAAYARELGIPSFVFRAA
jgi:hypothetical protein